MRRHRLKREIVSTQIANDLVNHMGITFVQRLKESTGMSPAKVAGAYVIVRDIFHLPHWFRQIEALDYKVSADVQLEMMDELMRLGRRATRWFLRARRNEQNAARDVAHFGPHLKELGLKLDELLEGPTREGWQKRYLAYVEAGVPELLARMVAGTSHLYTLLPVIEASDVTGQDPAEVAKAYFAVGEKLDITWYLQQISALPVENNWQALAREAFRDDVDWQQRAITISVLQLGEGSVEARLEAWIAQHESMIERWRSMLVEIRAASGTDYAMYAVANRELLDLALSGQAVVPAAAQTSAELEPA
jgi:glutamate dehydrogenase